MTAEIGILNRRGVALAADSAVTINQRAALNTLNNATKLFTLDSSHYIGIMINGNAEFMDVPWEVIIKSYREAQKNITFPKITDYVDSLIKYIENLNIYNSNSYESLIVNYCVELINQLNLLMERDKKDLSVEINAFQDIVSDSKRIFDFDVNKFNEEYGNLIKNIFLQYFPKKGKLISSFQDIVVQYIASDLYSESQTGLVIAGYGNEEIFPSIIELNIYGMIDGQIKYFTNNTVSTDPITSDVTASINPFAQHEMVSTVLSGIDPNLDNFLQHQLNSMKSKLIEYFGTENKETLDELFEKNDKMFEDYIRKNYTSPITNMLKSLSVDELGNMAETLVSLTSFKRKYSGAVRTVGGPIDVLVISKGEGPIWLKRKKYFDREMNEGYFVRRK